MNGFDHSLVSAFSFSNRCECEKMSSDYGGFEDEFLVVGVVVIGC
jgi:hypothetical protein